MKKREIGMARKRAENREGSLGFPGFVKPVFTQDSKPLGRRKRSLGHLGSVNPVLTKEENVELLVMKDLCSDVLIGHILNRHSSVEIGFDGNRPPLTICSLAVAQVPPVSLFSNLNPDCRPLVSKSRRQTVEDNIFMALEVQKLLQEGVIEPSNSPWMAQAFVIRGENHKPRMVVDYSQTINKYTLLDAYPLPKIEEVILKISKNKVFSKIDLQSAYIQIPIQDSERHYTAFEACGKLYQFLRVPFGVTNGVACFQRVIDKIIEDEGLTLTYPFIDDVTVCGKDQKEHDDNLEKFMTDGIIKPDPERLKPLRDIPVPKDSSALQRALGMFAHYCRWIPGFSKKIRPLLGKKRFPLSRDAVLTFNSLKDDVANAALATIKDDIPFRVETDSSDFAIGATLSQAGRPVAFFSRTLHSSELRHSSPEKEAYAIVESLRHWRHFLMGKHFEVFTDQQAVAFVFNQQHGSKIKNEKLIRWRLELASFKFDIIYRPGIATSRTTPYNPAGNGQVERYNGIIWKTIQLALRSNSMKTEQWEGVIQTALHSIRSLLCTATNATPHERMFSHPRRSHNGCSIPTWLTKPGPVLMKNQMRANKYEPIVQEVELIEANPDYAHVKLGDGRETTVSIRHLALRGETTRFEDNKGAEENVQAYPADGSKRADYVGCGVVIEDVMHGYRLDTSCSIFTAEAVTIYRALQLIDSNMPRKYCIYTDSMSVLEALENYNDRCHPVVCKILDITNRLYSKGFDIVFCWLPSHVGIIGNEQANSAAKSATTHLPLAVPLSDMKRVIMHHIFKLWQESWSQQLDNKLHSVKPVIGAWPVMPMRRTDVKLTRLRIGHTRFTHRHLLLGEDAPEYLQPINSDSAITSEVSTEQNMNTVALRTRSRHRQPPAYLKDYIRD
ncbi:retrovirus-related Pol polyprotein from transposon opus [Trichonephila clavipes]|nr:retrovirus-related Pol polyprotein from transposon opus [Trichonephila clavipes]